VLDEEVGSVEVATTDVIDTEPCPLTPDSWAEVESVDESRLSVLVEV
jgi:hypothetical protein